jgi:hypothetical protein
MDSKSFNHNPTPFMFTVSDSCANIVAVYRGFTFLQFSHHPIFTDLAPLPKLRVVSACSLDLPSKERHTSGRARPSVSTIVTQTAGLYVPSFSSNPVSMH